MTLKTCYARLKMALNRWSTKIFYSSRSHNLLNYATLDIKDTEIKKELVNFRHGWLDTIYKFCVILVALDISWSLILQFIT